MIWLTWRQFRVPALTVLAGLAVFGLALAVTGPRLVQEYHLSGLAACIGDANCGNAQQSFAFQVRQTGIDLPLYVLGVALTYLIAAVIGMFWGAPLVARELEAGTFRLAWTQSVTRSRWLAVKLALVGLAAMTATGLLSLAVTWWSEPIDQASARPAADAGLALPARLAPLIFGARGIAPIGYAAFAFVLGVAAGVMLRRTVPAIALTLAVLATVQVLVPAVLRGHYQAPAVSTTALVLAPDRPQSLQLRDGKLTVVAPVAMPGAWITSVRTVDSAGRTATPAIPQACADPGGRLADCDKAINALGLRQVVTYHPANRFWVFQCYELGLYLALTALLAALCARRIRR
jgi:hypothetical protein